MDSGTGGAGGPYISATAVEATHPCGCWQSKMGVFWR